MYTSPWFLTFSLLSTVSLLAKPKLTVTCVVLHGWTNHLLWLVVCMFTFLQPRRWHPHVDVSYLGIKMLERKRWDLIFLIKSTGTLHHKQYSNFYSSQWPFLMMNDEWKAYEWKRPLILSFLIKITILERLLLVIIIVIIDFQKECSCWIPVHWETIDRQNAEESSPLPIPSARLKWSHRDLVSPRLDKYRSSLKEGSLSSERTKGPRWESENLPEFWCM